jgi:glutaredoxin-like YruB-family protein
VSYNQNVGVIIYTTPTCQYCHAAKHLFDQYGVAYRDLDVSGNPEAAQEMLYKSGQLGTPVIDINGLIVVGYEPSSILIALRQNGYIQ